MAPINPPTVPLNAPLAAVGATAANGHDKPHTKEPDAKALDLRIIALGLLGAVAIEVGGWRQGWLTSSSDQLFTSAAVAIVALLLFVEAIAAVAGSSFLYSVIMGEDGRTSTSKAFVFMWTVLVGWALLALVAAGELLAKHSCAVLKTTCASDGVGFLQLGWSSLLNSGLDTPYLLLLGIPAGAAVAAKLVTQNKAATKSLAVRPVLKDDKTLRSRVTQIFSADDGTTDIGDFQYVLFNLILATYFVSGLLNLTSVGLPIIPGTLLSLTSVSAALYVGKKAATSIQPAINAVIPSTLGANQRMTIVGTDLTDDPSMVVSRLAPRVMINGVEAIDALADPTTANRITATVPDGLNASAETVDGEVEVVSSFGYKTLPFRVRIKP